MSVAGQWQTIGSELPDEWVSCELRLELPDREAADRAAAALAPASPYRAAPTILRFFVARDGSAIGPDNVARLLRRVHRGTLSLAGSRAAARPAPREEVSLVESWDAAVAGVPDDWSDLYAEVEFTSTDYIDRGAVLCIQMNPRRDGKRPAFRFRCAKNAGYGVAPEMARRCFERCDEERIRGSVKILHVLSGTHLVATQGPVWLLDGLTI